MQSFEHALKTVLKSNINGYAYLYNIFVNNPNFPDSKMLAELCKVGIQNNFVVLRFVNNMSFVAEDEYSQFAENEAFNGQDVSDMQEEGHVANRPRIRAPKKDEALEELERLYKLERSEHAVEKIDPDWYKNFLKKEDELSGNNKESGTIEGNGQAEGSNGTQV